ncbi:MAG: GNAT family N-acetyltransferase [Bacilli bacterium]|nr:GNAT family N-acetyltransferase [Bacilli bacterium]
MPEFKIRDFLLEDKDYILIMMIEFYASPAVIHKPEVEVLKRNIDACLNPDIPLRGIVFTIDDKIVGYSMLAMSFSTEYGVPCVWIEDIFVKEKYRNRGIGTEFFNYLKREYPREQYRLRLEVEKDNERAISFYEQNGLTDIEYLQKEIEVKY